MDSVKYNFKFKNNSHASVVHSRTLRLNNSWIPEKDVKGKALAYIPTQVLSPCGPWNTTRSDS